MEVRCARWPERGRATALTSSEMGAARNKFGPVVIERRCAARRRGGPWDVRIWNYN
jgi:hypothetical protein